MAAKITGADRYGVRWPDVPAAERCPHCGQPDNCGDCNHAPLTDRDVTALGGIFPDSDRAEMAADAEGERRRDAREE